MWKLKREYKNGIFAVGIIMLFLISPLYMNYLPASTKLGTYFMEKEGIRGPFLYLPILFLKFGLSVQGSCKLYICLTSLLACVISLYCFAKIVNNLYLGLAGCLCYVFSLYSVSIRYKEGAMGEMMAFVFLPLIIYGLYGLYTKEPGKNKYGKSAIPFFIGVLGIYMSHIPIAMICTFFVFIFCILQWKKTFRLYTFMLILISEILAVGITFPIWMAYGKAMIAGRQYAENGFGKTFPERLLQPAQLFLSFYGNNGNHIEGQPTMYYIGLGLPLFVVLLAWLLLYGVADRSAYDTEKKVAFWVIGMAVLSMFMSTILFPWLAIQQWHWLCGLILEHIGYPYRFLCVAVLLLSLSVSLIGKVLCDKVSKRLLPFLVAVITLNVLSGIYLMNDILYTNEKNPSYEAELMVQDSDFIFYISE